MTSKTLYTINDEISLSNLNATRVTATVIGVFFGLFSGINHGLFELLQGNTPTDGLVINAIGEAQRFWLEGTEPAFTIIPNFMITGILSMIVGLAIIVWSLWFLPSKHGRTVFLGTVYPEFPSGRRYWTGGFLYSSLGFCDSHE